MKFKVNTQLLPIKAHYFLWSAGIGSVMPFVSVYAKQLGASAFIIGILYTITPIISLILQPIIGGIADAYKVQKKIFLFIQTMCACGCISLIFLPTFPKPQSVNFNCTSFGSFLNIQNDITSTNRLLLGGSTSDGIVCTANCPTWLEEPKQFKVHMATNVTNTTTNRDGNIQFPIRYFDVNNTRTPTVCDNITSFSAECEMYCDTSTLNGIVTKSKTLDNEFFVYYQFWLLLLTHFMISGGNMLVLNVSEAICFQILGEKNYKYGYQKLFSSLGWGTFGIIAGSLIDFFNKGGATDHTTTFVMACGLLILSVLASSRMEYTQQTHRANLIRDMTQSLLNMRIAIFILWCIFLGACCGISWSFVFWLLEDLASTLDSNVKNRIKTIEGLSIGVESYLGELPCYFCSTWIIQKLGYINMMTLTLFLSGARFIVYSFLSNPWWGVPVAALTGATYSLSYTTMVSYASIVAPRGAETSTQGLVGAAFLGGVSVGGFSGGLLISKFGAPTMFRIIGVASLVLCVVHCVVQCLIKACQNNPEKKANQINLL